jgi:hypothetical protein
VAVPLILALPMSHCPANISSPQGPARSFSTGSVRTFKLMWLFTSFGVSNGMDAHTFEGIDVPEFKCQQVLEQEGANTMQIMTMRGLGRFYGKRMSASV